MSGAALGWAKAQVAPSVIAKSILICLADYADADGLAWPKIKSLAAEVQISPRSVSRALRSLEEAGLIETTPWDREDGGQTSNRYRLNMHPPHDTLSCPPCQAVMPPMTLLSCANGTPDELSPSDEGERATAKLSFDDWWSEYPSKVGKRAAQTAFDRAMKRLRLAKRDAAAVLRDGLRRAKASKRWADPTYTIPNPATWLNQDRWDDETEPATGPPSPANDPEALARQSRHEAILARLNDVPAS